MKKLNSLLVLTFAFFTLVSTSCKKDDPKPAPAATTNTNTIGTFTVNGEVQTPAIVTRNVYAASGKQFTQTVVQNDKYGLKIEFTNATMASGEYTITQTFLTGDRNANITFTDRTSGETKLVGDMPEKVVVNGDRITFKPITFMLKDKNVTLSGDYTVTAK